jgi:hypothetical protein
VEPPGGAEAVLTRFVRQMADPAIPAVVTDVAWNVLAWNRALSTWFPDPGTLPAEERNAVLWAFTRQIESIVDDIHSFREAPSGGFICPGKPSRPAADHLIDRLQRIPTARQLWGRQHIAEFTSCISPVRLWLPGSGTVVGPPAQHRVSRRVPRADARALQRMAGPAVQPHPPDQAQDQQARRESPATRMITATVSRRPRASDGRRRSPRLSNGTVILPRG